MLSEIVRFTINKQNKNVFPWFLTDKAASYNTDAVLLLVAMLFHLPPMFSTEMTVCYQLQKSLKLYCSGIFYVDKRQEDTVQCKANGLMLSFQYSVILICLLCIFHYVVSFYLIKVSDFSVQRSYCV